MLPQAKHAFTNTRAIAYHAAAGSIIEEERMSYEAKLRELGYTIEPIDLNAGKIMHAVRTGNLIYTSGQVSRWGGREIKGKVGRDLSLEEGYEAAQLSALSCLSAIKTLAGSLDSVVQVVKVLGMV